MAENVKLPTGGARIGRATQKSTGLGVSPYGTYLLSFVTFGQAVLKIIIGNQLQIYDTKWPPGGARIDASTSKSTGLGPSWWGTIVQSFVAFRQAVLKINLGNQLWTDQPTNQPTNRQAADNMRPLSCGRIKMQ